MSRRPLLVAALLLICSCAAADAPKPAAKRPLTRAEAVERFRNLKFGLFVHWGPCSLTGKELSWARKRGQVPANVYDNLYKEFNPTKFNAAEWVQVARDAGMNYMVFTAKHHDGFCNFDTKLTDYKITSKESPFGRDVCKELSEACAKDNMVLGFYYSQRDWVSPLFLGGNYRAHAQQTVHKQVAELCTNYGDVGMIWFDATAFSAKQWDANNLFAIIRRLQPAALINDRCGRPADFKTYENRVGPYDRRHLWESCSKLGGQWGWKPDDRMLPLNMIVRVLVEIVGNDGNWLLNVGPMPDGRIEPRQAARLKEIGDWLRKYGESIYGTRGGPYRGTRQWRATCKGNAVYIHILDRPDAPVTLPPLKRTVLKTSLLTGGEADVKQTPEGITVTVPPEHRHALDTILKLELDGPAFDAR